MGFHEFIKAKKEKRGSSRSFFSVMILKGLGRVRTFNISYGALVCVAVVVALYLIFSAVTIISYFVEAHSRGVRSDLLQGLQGQVENTRKELYRARQRLRFLEDCLGGPEGRDGKASESPEPGPGRGVEGGPLNGAGDGGAALAPMVAVKNLSASKSGGRLSVKFRLVKIKPDGTRASGYVFMIASDLKSDPPRLWSHPRTTLKNGEPVDYRQGQAFKVRNYRTIRGRYFLDPKSEIPTLLTILVYDDSGRLRLKRVFPIEG